MTSSDRSKFREPRVRFGLVKGIVILDYRPILRVLGQFASFLKQRIYLGNTRAFRSRLDLNPGALMSKGVKADYLVGKVTNKCGFFFQTVVGDIGELLSDLRSFKTSIIQQDNAHHCES
jgi:hypothetical protein